MAHFFDAYVCNIQVWGQLATIAIAVLTVPLWLETRRQRKALRKPLLVPARLRRLPDIPGSLFAANFCYPRDDSYKHTGLVYLGIKNIGAGPAMFAWVQSFVPGVGAQTERGDFVHIPEGQTAPLLIRFGYNDASDLDDKAHRVVISYSDTFGDAYVLQADLWFSQLKDREHADAIVIQHSSSDKPMREAWVPIFRGMEYKGYFELMKVFPPEKSESGDGGVNSGR